MGSVELRQEAFLAVQKLGRSVRSPGRHVA